MSDPLAHLGEALAALGREGRLRERRPPPPGALVLCSNDYLGLARAPAGDAADPPDPSGPRRPPPADLGAGASRLVSGERPEHLALERDLAAWLGAPAALAFSSGYAANLGLLSALAGPGDVVVSDALNHASIVDGCRLSRARVAIVAHRDAGAVERALAAHRDGGGRRYVVTESYFSMDGDSPDLPALRRIADAYGAALLVDEAHALGVFGPEGRGLAAARGVRPDALVGAFGKALGAQGAFVAGSADLVAWLWNRARPFVFSTGLSPLLAARVRRNVALARRAGPQRERLAALSARLRGALRALDYRVPDASHGPVVPVLVGPSRAALELSAALAERGIWAPAIRPPTVPEGSARLRLTLHAALGEAELERAIDALRALRPLLPSLPPSLPPSSPSPPASASSPSPPASPSSPSSPSPVVGP